MNGGDSVSDLISAFEATALSLHEKKGGKPLRLLPTPLQLYQVGKLLYETEAQASEAHVALLKSYQLLLEELPVSYLRNVLFHDLNIAFAQATGTIDAVHAMCGLYADTTLACRAGYSVDLCKSLCTAYSVLNPQKDYNRECTALLRSLSSLLLESDLFASNDEQEETQLQKIMGVIQALTEDEHNTCFGDMIEWQERTIPTRFLPIVVKSRFDETPQREYLLLMLTSSPRSGSVQPTQHPSQQQEQSPVSAKTVSAGSEIQRRIQLVRDVLPELGEGFVETALSCFQGDADRTVAALLEAQSDPMSLPPVLQMMDPKLPKRHTETTPDSYSLNDDEARRITKARLADMERTQEAEAYALAVVGKNDEYDDDYDDQYDGLDGGGDLGGGDGETYDVDLDTIRNYNRAAMAAVAEDSFWVSIIVYKSLVSITLLTLCFTLYVRRRRIATSIEQNKSIKRRKRMATTKRRQRSIVARTREKAAELLDQMASIFQSRRAAGRKRRNSKAKVVARRRTQTPRTRRAKTRAKSSRKERTRQRSQTIIERSVHKRRLRKECSPQVVRITSIAITNTSP